ncbi:MAG: efflux RND transporter periplasmic adaptor subunit [Desulforhopalus sp.]
MQLKRWGSRLVIILTLTSLLSSCDKDEIVSKKEVFPLQSTAVTVNKVSKRIADNQVALVGTVQAVERAEISSKISGNIITLQADLGSRVRQGDLLIELSAGEISAQVQRAKAELEQTKRNLAREAGLLKKNAATQETVKSLQDNARIAEAAYREAVNMLNYSRITAPFSGIVTNKLSNIGDLAIPGKPLLFIEEENNLQVLTDIPEAMILHIQKGDRLSVFIPSVNLTTEGIVDEISPVAHPSSRSAPIKLRIAPDHRLRSGQFARVTLSLDQSETLTVPDSAVLPFGQMNRVFVVDDNKARLRLVRTGAKQDDYIEILSGLSEGETIITQGNRNLLDGQPVIIQQDINGSPNIQNN